MCEKYLERIFLDVGKPNLQTRCLEVIKALKIDSEVLTGPEHEHIHGQGINFDSWQHEENQENEKTLEDRHVKVDVKNVMDE